MKPGSQLNQAKLIAPLIAHRDVVFVGDGDCMALALAYLADRGIIEGPNHMQVYDFDERIVEFVTNTARTLHLSKQVTAEVYNVRDAPPRSSLHKNDVFYTNPPYGSQNEGFSAIAFLARCMDMCKTIGSSGAAILPFDSHEEWTRKAMHRIQEFMCEHGYVVSEMLTEMHLYHLDDRPELRSGTVVFHRVAEASSEYANRAFSTDELALFYGSSVGAFPQGIDVAGNLILNSS
jgi:predicted methyltransferase